MTFLSLFFPRAVPAVRPLVEAWVLCTVGQVADAIVNADPGWSLPPIVSWSSIHMLLALLTCGLLALVSNGDDDGGSGALAFVRSIPRVRRPLLGALALLVGLLLGIVVLVQPTILLPAMGLALTHRLWATPLHAQVRA